jgi:hypothetical protein
VHHLQVYYVFLLYLITELYQLSETVQDPFGEHYCKIHDVDNNDDDKSGKSRSGVRSSRIVHMAFQLPFY